MIGFSGHGGIKSKVELSNLGGLLQPQWFCGSSQPTSALTGLPEAGMEHTQVQQTAGGKKRRCFTLLKTLQQGKVLDFCMAEGKKSLVLPALESSFILPISVL